MTLRIAIATLAAVLCSTAAASAHVQVTPSEVAPDDAVRFEVLVPNERDQATTEVAVQVPPGVLPFSFEEVPGWKRSEEPAGDGSTGVIRWRGRLDPGAFVRFTFLAATPAKPTTIAWKALQTYDDGETVRWIGDEQSEFPAATTQVSTAAERANAGGEGEAAGGAPAGAPPPAVRATEPGRDTLTLVLAGVALAMALIALGLTARRR